MQSLRDQLLKSGVATKKQKQQVEQEKRRERKRHRKGEVEEATLAQQRQAHATRLEAQRNADRQRAAVQRASLEAKEQCLRIQHIIDYWQTPEDARAEERWYFQTRHNTIAHIYVSEPTAARLEVGDLAIVERPETEESPYVLVPREAAAYIARVDQQYVRFTNSTLTDSTAAQA
jgi:uncharacterized protein YaiL (DUF2058 family)